MSRLDPEVFDLHRFRALRMRQQAIWAFSWYHFWRTSWQALTRIIANFAKTEQQPAINQPILAYVLISQPLDAQLRGFIARYLTTLIAEQLAMPPQQISLLLEATPYVTHHQAGEAGCHIGGMFHLNLTETRLHRRATQALPQLVSDFLRETFGERFSTCSFNFAASAPAYGLRGWANKSSKAE